MTDLLYRRASGPQAQSFMALDVWLLVCIVFVFGALIEYAFILKVRYANASVRNVLFRKTKRKDGNSDDEDDVNPTGRGIRGKSKVSILSRSRRPDAEVIVERCREIDSWALVIFTAAGIIANFIYWITYGLGSASSN